MKSLRKNEMDEEENGFGDDFNDHHADMSRVTLHDRKEEAKDAPLFLVIKHLRKFLGSGRLAEAARIEEARYAAMKKERVAMVMLWRRHLEYIKVKDELAMMRGRLVLGQKNADDRSVVAQGDLHGNYASAHQDAVSAWFDLKEVQSKQQFFRGQVILTQLEQQKRKSHDHGSICSICKEANFEDGLEVVMTNCAHLFHRECIEIWLRKGNSSCPLRCPQKCTQRDLREVSNRRLASSGKQWGQKVDALLLDLMELNKSEEKGIVFSQWLENLEVLATALTRSSIPFVHIKAKGKTFIKAIKEFKADDDKKILLLPINLGAEGLDLIAACHIFFIEPLVNKAMMQQAENRVIRIGQTKPCIIHKYITHRTVEERIHLSSAIEVEDEEEALEQVEEEDEAQEEVSSPRKSRKRSHKNTSIDAGSLTKIKLNEYLSPFSASGKESESI